MAGLDYSAVREPDYNAEALRQSEQITQNIERTSSEIMMLWKKRLEMKKSVVGTERYIKRKKHIYYDTDGISEQQEETVRVCDDCGGLVMIDSFADTGKRIFAVIIPGHSCPVCRDEVEAFFDRLQKGKYRYIYFQDRDRDIYINK